MYEHMYHTYTNTHKHIHMLFTCAYIHNTRAHTYTTHVHTHNKYIHIPHTCAHHTHKHTCTHICHKHTGKTQSPEDNHYQKLAV